MDKEVTRILKSNEVNLQGRVQLHLMQPQQACGGPKDASAAPAKQQVRIVESHPEYAVIEITCCCGTRIYLRCEYTGQES